MTDQSPSELERDAERVRAEIAATADQLKDKMSPGQLMDEITSYFKDGDTNQMLSNLKHQVRDNPLALAVIGGGLAWLMMGSGPSTGTGPSLRQNPLAGHGPHSRPLAGSNTYRGMPSGAESAAASHGSSASVESSTLVKGLGDVKDAAGSVAEKVSDAAGSASDSISAALHDVRDTLGGGTDYVAQAGADLGARAKTTFLDALEREPLVIGALGVAVGAAIGAMLPVTKAEQEYLGTASAKAREGAETALAQSIDKAKDVAGGVYNAARDEADRQGLTPGSKPIAEKLATVAKAAGAELKAAAESSISEAKDAADQKTDKLSSESKRAT